MFTMKRLLLMITVTIIFVVAGAFFYSAVRPKPVPARIPKGVTVLKPRMVQKNTSTKEKRSNIPIRNNSLELAVTAEYVEVLQGTPYLEFKYYNDGNSIVMQTKAVNLENLNNWNSKDKALFGMPVRGIYLNYLKPSAYMFFKDDPSNERYILIDINLKNGGVVKLETVENQPSQLIASATGKYITFKSTDTVNLLKSKLYVINTETNEGIVRGSEYLDKGTIGKKSTKSLDYSFEPKSWYTQSVVRLSQTTFQKKRQSIDKVSSDVLYDVESNRFLGEDLAVISTAQNNKKVLKKGDSSKKTISVVSKTLISLFEQASQNNFEEVYNLFGDEISIDVFGFKTAEPVKKSQVDRNLFLQTYGNIVKNAKIKEIVKETVSDDYAEVYYTHIQISKDGTGIEYPMIVMLKKYNNTWKISGFKEQGK